MLGSVLNDNFRSDSDVDVLVVFEKDCTPGCFGMARMARELSGIFGNRQVDFRVPEELSRYFRDGIMTGAKDLYVA